MTDDEFPDLEECQISPQEAIKRVKAPRRGQKIAWGEEFNAWPVSRQVSWLKSFAESMNSAADTIQQERDKLNDIAKHQEVQLVQAREDAIRAAESFNREIARIDKDLQVAYRQLMQAQAEVKEKARRIAVLEAGRGD